MHNMEKCGRGKGRPQGCSLRSHRRRRLAPLPPPFSPAPMLRHVVYASLLHFGVETAKEKKAVSPVEWSPCSPRTIQPPLTASPCNRLSRSRSTISQSDFHPIIRPFSPYRLGGSYKLALEPDGSPLFISIPLVACWRYEPREHHKPLALTRPAIPPSPERDRVGYSDH